ncbi:MAG: hypothetical protein V1744_08320 [Candidatus Altiarchaeota archaeon]
MELINAFLVVLSLAITVSAAGGNSPLLESIELHIGLVLLIASIVVIILMVMMLIYLHSISEHLNWIRRVR